METLRVSEPTRHFRRDLRSRTQRVAERNESVLIIGAPEARPREFARHLHHISPRQDARTVTFNADGLPPALIYSELFGHLKDSFAGAFREKCGLVSTLGRGTLIIENLERCSAEIQTALGTFIASKEIVPFGARRPVEAADVRIIGIVDRRCAQHGLAPGLSSQFRDVFTLAYKYM